MDARTEIEEIVHRETRAWDTQDVDLLLSIFHPDIVWPWPPTNRDHDPATWHFVLGRFDAQRWSALFRKLFARCELVHNRRSLKAIVVTEQEDGAFAVVDVDTLWRDRENGRLEHWCGRACKIYARVGGDWKMTAHTGLLDYSSTCS